MNTPSTEYVLVRTPRIKDDNGETKISMSVYKNYGEGFDFSEYSCLRVNPGTDVPMEEWVPTAELELYKKVSL